MHTDAMPLALDAKIQKARSDLDLKDVDYEGTMKAKLSIARLLFDQQGHKDLKVSSCLLRHALSSHLHVHSDVLTKLTCC